MKTSYSYFTILLACCLCCFSCSPTVDTSDDLPLGAQFNVEKSMEYLGKIIDHDPDNKEARYQRAKLYMEMATPLKAKEDIVVSLSEDAKNPDFLLLKSKIDKQLGQVEEALLSVDKIQQLGLKVQTVDYLLFATEINLEVGNLDKAGSFLRQATEYAPNYPRLLYQRARYYAYLQDTSKAFAFQKLALAEDSSLDEAKIGLAELYIKRHQVDSSLLFLSKVKQPVKDIRYHSSLAKALSLTGYADSASGYWYATLRMSPYDPEANYEMAKYYMVKGNMSSGADFLKRIPENDRNKFKDYNYKFAVANEALGNEDIAQEYFSKQYTIDSTVLNKAKTKRKKTPSPAIVLPPN